MKRTRRLSELVTKVEFPTGAIVPVGFGIMRESDANNDDVIIGADYAVLWLCLGQTSGAGLDRCDFNPDGAVTGVDYSWRGIALDRSDLPPIAVPPTELESPTF